MKRPQDAAEIWAEKLRFYLAEEAKASSPERRFELRQLIEEAREKIRTSETDPDNPTRDSGKPIQTQKSGDQSVNIQIGGSLHIKTNE